MTTTGLTLVEALDDVATAATALQSVYLDGETWSRILELKDQMSDGKQRNENPAKLQAEIDQLNEHLKRSELRVTFAAIPDYDFESLADKYPNKENPLYRWDEKTFAPALVAKTCVKVDGFWEADGLDEKEAAALFGRLNSKQAKNLFATAIGLQTIAVEPFSSAATGQTDGSVPNSTTATSTDSPIPFS